MNKGRYNAINKKIPALVLTAGMLLSTACSDKDDKTAASVRPEEDRHSNSAPAYTISKFCAFQRRLRYRRL